VRPWQTVAQRQELLIQIPVQFCNPLSLKYAFELPLFWDPRLDWVDDLIWKKSREFAPQEGRG
jgi:hypothetical protein